MTKIETTDVSVNEIDHCQNCVRAIVPIIIQDDLKATLNTLEADETDCKLEKVSPYLTEMLKLKRNPIIT